MRFPFLFPSILFLLCGFPTLSLATPELVDRIVAVVDDQVILWSELNYRLRFELEQRGIRLASPDTLAKLRNQILDEMIDEQVLVLKAKEDSVQVDASEIEDLLAEQFRTIKSSMTDEEFKDMLNRVGLTERQLRTRYRKEIRHRLLYRQMLGRVASRLHITRRDIEAFQRTYQDSLPPRISISHILLKVHPSEEVLRKKRAVVEEIQKKLSAGEDFAQLARQYSEDPGTASRGGDLGCFEAGHLMPEFEKAAFALKPGEISEPVLTRYGYHLIQLLEKRENTLCARHILIMARATEKDRERVRRRLEELRKRALSGEDFAQLAHTYSEDEQTAARGGLLNTFSRDQIPSFLRPYIQGLKLGDISQPFFLDDGGHLVKINDDQATIESLLREERTAAAVKKLIGGYKKKLYIEKRLDDDFLREPVYGASGHLSEEHRSDQAAQ